MKIINSDEIRGILSSYFKRYRCVQTKDIQFVMEDLQEILSKKYPNYIWCVSYDRGSNIRDLKPVIERYGILVGHMGKDFPGMMFNFWEEK